MIGKFAFVLGCTSVYTVVRYVAFGEVSPAHIPVYLLNKSVSMASVICLLPTAINHAKGHPKETRYWGTAALNCAFVHILLSLTILSDAYYPKFFGTEKMNLTGELTMLLGVLTTCCFWRFNTACSDFIQRRLRLVLACAFVAGHLAAMGLPGWLAPGKWHGGLPPISLVSFVFAVASLVIFLKSGAKKPAQ